MSSTLTDRQQWRRYLVTEGYVQNALEREGARSIHGEGSCEFYWGILEDAALDRCLNAPDPIPPAPRFPQAGEGLDVPPLWCMVAFLLANVAAWVITLATVVGWVLAVVRGG